jgi:hypothetical protein
MFYLLQLHQKTKNIFIYIIGLLSAFTFCYFILLAVLIMKPYAWQPLGGVGDGWQGVFLQVA